MPNVNTVILMGVLGRDPETKQLPNGGSIATFSMATTEPRPLENVKRLQSGIELLPATD